MSAQAERVAHLMESAEARLWAGLSDTVNPLLAGHRLAARRFGEDLDLISDGVAALGGTYARVIAVDGDPRRFDLATAADRQAGTPALLLRVEPEGAEWSDVVALSLKEGARRFWRLTCGGDFLGDIWPDKAGVVQLRQEAHDYFRSMLKAAGYGRRAKLEGEAAHLKRVLQARLETGVASFAEVAGRAAEDPARAAYVAGLKDAGRIRDEVEGRWRLAATPPDGALVLDPMIVPWTRTAALKGVEWVEIVDAPEGGPLGRALIKLNPRFNTARGPRLTGLAPQAPVRRRAA